MSEKSESLPSNPLHVGQTRLRELVWVFLRLGTIAFGGPAAHAAMMEDEVVRRRGWMTREKFLDLLGAVNLIPGPNSTEMAIHIGYLRAGWPGLIVAGVCFILPAMLIVIALAWIYVRFGSLPEVEGLLYGVKPVVIAIIAQALFRLGSIALKTYLLAVVAVLCVGANGLGANEILLLLAAGAAMSLWQGGGRGRGEKPSTLGGMILAVLGILAIVYFVALINMPSDTGYGLRPLFLFFLKVGSVLYGGGYVLLAFIQADLVSHWHWLTANQLLDATAVGQFSPGPLFTTATFIGYLLGGLPGALVATVGIFLPAFVFAALIG